MAPKACTFSFLIIFFFFFFFPLASPVEFNYPAVFNFGDSNSDTGNLLAGLGGRLYPPYGQSYFTEPSGRFCDGRLIIDFLSKHISLTELKCFSCLNYHQELEPFFTCKCTVDAMDLPFLRAYLEATGAPSFKRGCNFAAAGSTVHPATASSVSPFSCGVQVAQFLRFKEKVQLIKNQSISISPQM